MRPLALLITCLPLTTMLVASRTEAIEVNQAAGAAHAYPVIRDLNGKQLGKGEFTQEVSGTLLRIKIRYDLENGSQIEEQASFQQRPELIQKEWSWRENKEDILQREYKIDFGSGKAISHKREKGELKEWSEKVEIDQGRTFAGFGFVLALQNLRDQLVKGAPVELKAVGFTPQPRVVTVKLSYNRRDRMQMSGRQVEGDHFLIQPEIPAVAKLFIKISDTHIWLTLPPAGFLRWEGPLAEPSDPLVRVDLTSGGESGPAHVVEKDS